MWPALFQKSVLPAVEQTLQFAERRHAILAGNIANADTPGYQTRDLSVSDFQSALKDVIQSKQAAETSHLAAVQLGYRRGFSVASDAQRERKYEANSVSRWK